MYKINQKYDIDILNYCKLNGIEDVELFVNQCFKQGLDVKKYGFLGGSDEKPEEIEIIREIRVEVPVEVIREVIVDRIIEKEVIKEVIIEVPVQVIEEKLIDKPIEIIKQVEVVKEVIVEKPVEIIKEIKVEIPVDRFVEVPVEVIKYVDKEVIKEVEKIVTNIEYICDETEINNLLGMIEELTKELENEKNNVKTIEIVKEVQVIVEKEVETSNDKSKMLENTLQNLRKELSLKNDRIKDLEEINKQLESIKVNQGAIFLKGSNLTQNL